MIKYVILFIILSIALCRWAYLKKMGKPSMFIWISAFMQTVPFGYNIKGFFDFVPSNYTNGQVITGAFGNTLSFEVSLLFFFIISASLTVTNKNRIKFEDIKWFFVFLAFCLISLFNPNNDLVFSSLVLASIFLQLLLFLLKVKLNVSKREILLGIYEGLFVTILFQLTLAICYPILNIKIVTELFRDLGEFDWTNRRAGYSSAIGTFRHPSGLALYSLLMAVFFGSCYLNKFRTKISFTAITICCMLIFLTFSRTTYIATGVVFSIIYVIYKQKEGIFSLKNITLGLLLMFSVTFILYLTPISDLFLKSDSDEQFDNRFNHIALGSAIWVNSPFIGVGINSHVYFMSKIMNTRLFSTIPFFEFLTSNPIHNIHMIVLAETGVLGFAVWVYYLVSRMAIFSRFNVKLGAYARIFNLTFVGCILSTLVYGLFGWQPFNLEIYTLIVTVGVFSVRPISIKRERYKKIDEI